MTSYLRTATMAELGVFSTTVTPGLTRGPAAFAEVAAPFAVAAGKRDPGSSPG
jgi:hypothetical protein